MAVLVRSPRDYAGLLEHALSRAGIPAWFDRGTGRPHPAGRAFLALLACAVERLSAARFAEYLSLAQVPDAGPAPGPQAPPPPADDLLSGFTGVETPRRRRRRRCGRARRPGSAPIAMPEPVVEGTLRAPWKWENADRRIGGHRRRPAALAPPARPGSRQRVSATAGRRGARGSGLAEAARIERDAAKPGPPPSLRAAAHRRARLVAGDGDLGRLARRASRRSRRCVLRRPDARAAGAAAS